jgi:hypothetical protein
MPPNPLVGPRPAAIRSGPQRPASLVDKQVRITTAKLNLDLYDRRFKVFEAARTVLILRYKKGT